jgi:hypothetical protein
MKDELAAIEPTLTTKAIPTRTRSVISETSKTVALI